MKKILLVLTLFLSCYFIYSFTNDKKISYLTIGDSLSKGTSEYGTSSKGYSEQLKEYLSNNQKLKDYKASVNMVCYDEARIDTTHKKYYCVYASRRKEHHYNTSLEDVKNRYAANIVTTFTNAPAIATAMGDYVLVARFENEEDIIPFVNSVIEGI